MKVLNLVENKFERIGHNFTNRFGTAFAEDTMDRALEG